MKMPGSVELTLVDLLEDAERKTLKEWAGLEGQTPLYTERLAYIAEALKWVQDASRE